MEDPSEEFYLAAIREFEKGSLEAARGFVEKLSRLEPDSERSVILKALLLEEDGQLSYAVSLLEDFTRKNLQSAHARSNLARLQWRTGDHRRALMTLRLSLAQEPNQERALRLFASMVESELNFKSAYEQLMMMAGTPSAWLPAWLAAELATVFGDIAQVETALSRAMERRAPSFPRERLLKILLSLRGREAGRVWDLVRPYAPPELLPEFDQRFLAARNYGQAPEARQWSQGLLRGGVFGSLLAPGESPTVALSVVHFLDGEKLVEGSLLGRLERGFSLLLAELLLLRFGVVADLSLPFVPQGGLVDEEGPTSGERLALRHKDTPADRLVSLYLSAQKSGELVLDAEFYQKDGTYVGRCAARGEGPERALAEMVDLLGERVYPTIDPVVFLGWESPLGLTHALAREVAAAFVLCGRNEMSMVAIPNPGLSLELLSETALESGTAADLLTLSVALRSAEACGVATAGQQRALLEEVALRDPGLAKVLR